MGYVRVFQQLEQHPVLCRLTLCEINQFIRLAAQLKRDIQLPLPPEQSNPECAPDVLPPSIEEFISKATGVPLSCIDALWDILKDDVWSASPGLLFDDDLMSFKEHGWALGLNCMRHGSILKKEEQRAVVVYTTGHGVLPAWSIHLSCSACHTNYHNNYSVCNGIRTYCPKKPTYIQVGEHQFVEEKVVALWTGQMLLGWFSASNAAKLYDMAMARDYLKGSKWPFGTKLTTNHVWDGFILAALLADHQRQGTCLQVPHTGEQKDHFKAAMESRNEHIVLYGQPGAVRHVCHKCMHVYEMDGEYRKCQVIVGDGINMGHPCCGIFFHGFFHTLTFLLNANFT